MHDGRNIIRKSASDLALALGWWPRAEQNGLSALYAFCRGMANVADDEFAPVEQRCERMNIGMVIEADKETTLSAGKDFIT